MMRVTRRSLVFWVWSLMLIGLTVPAWGQIIPTASLYRLEVGSNFTRGCYPPCLCPIATTSNIRGTFKLTFDHQDPLFTYYRVGNVNWNVTLGNQEFRVIGSGTYKRGGQLAQQHQMTLTLTVDGVQPQTFDSGLVQGGGSFPDISITVSVNGMQCYDTVVGIVAKVVPAADIVPYNLKDSNYEEGCFPPCDCLLQTWPLAGTFRLVALPNATTPIHREWALVDINWNTITTTPPGRNFTGFGNYAITDVGPTNNQRMQLDIFEPTGTATPTRFNSGTVAGGSQFPEIDINLAVNGFVCYDRAFFLHCKPQ
jgi:hypothetical protein